MRQFTPKRQSIEARYRENKKARYEAMMDEQSYISCEGCGTTRGPLESSHHVRRSFDSTLIDDPDNIAIMCRKCHELVEACEYDDLLNGEVIRTYVQRKAPSLLVIHGLKVDANRAEQIQAEIDELQAKIKTLEKELNAALAA